MYAVDVGVLLLFVFTGNSVSALLIRGVLSAGRGDKGWGGLKGGDQGVKGVASMILCFRILMISEICFDAKNYNQKSIQK